jgi:hypothetical protein
MFNRINPFALVLCRNTDADEADYRRIPRWYLWTRRFRSGFSRYWEPV